MNRRHWLLGLVVLLGGAAIGRMFSLAPPPEESFAERPVRFELEDQNGQRVRAEDLRGRILLVFFGYTHCPDICPATLVQMSEVRRQLAPEAPFAGLFITVDPARDNRGRLKQYVDHFDPELLGLRGTPARIAEAARSFGAVYERGGDLPDGGYLMGHTAFGYVVDSAGRVAQVFEQGTSADAYAAHIRSLLVE
ncbi:MAG: redoxin domain-containing protein [Gammaproteobacteria bacterium]|nr:redoxin domain-containing protein [Gammaproteobacteria bacterium]